MAIENKALRGLVWRGVILHPWAGPQSLAEPAVSPSTSGLDGIGQNSRQREAEGV